MTTLTKSLGTIALAFPLLCCTGQLFAADPTPISEQYKLIKAPTAVGKLGTDLFGDRINYYNGALEFVQQDVSLTGNSALPVSVGRRFAVGDKHLTDGMFREWDIEIPHIHGTFSREFGWQPQRCSNFGQPPDVGNGQTTFRSFEYWHGNYLYVPGAGEQEVLKRSASNTNVPSDGLATPLVTRNHWAIRCLPALASAIPGTPSQENGEGFLAISPDGTQYRFDWLVVRAAGTLSKPSEAQPNPELAARVTPGSQNGTGGTTYYGMPRVAVWIMPTLVTDRFGNTVRYTYDPSDKGKLLSIEASDGRALRMEYHPELPHIAAVSDGTRTWRYEYGQVASGRTMLTRVVLPDQSSWQLGGLDGGADHMGQQGLEGLVQMELRYQPDADTPPSRCDEAPAGLDGRTGIGVMVHPSGAVGKFTMQPSSHGRNGVPLACYNNGSVYGAPYFPAFIDGYSLTEKAIWGPGLEPLIWRINYDGTLVSGWSDCSAYIAPSVVLATGPKGEVTRYVFGSTFRVDEGLLKQVDIGWRNGSALRSTVTRYDRSFKEPVGTSDQDRGDNWTTTHLLPTDQTRITQQGVTFSWQVPSSGDFDRFARPTRIVRSSSLGASRTEVTRYADQLQTWMLGQVESVTEAASGKVMEQHSYDTRTGSLLTSSRFGLLQSTLTYHPDGMLASSSDGREQTTSYLDYYRGVPTRIVYADGAVEHAAVNEFGRIVTFTDAIGALTRFDDDAMGRFTGVHYPQDGTGWNDTTISFAQSWNEHHGLPAGHWRQDITTGNGRTSNYFDALWRPVYTETYDAADPAASMEVRHHRYDLAGYPSYASYPQRDYSQLGPGVYTSYDALGRTTLTAWNSELGALSSNKVYGDGFSTTDIDARGHSSVSRYQVFDQPTDEALLQSEQPLGVRVDIARDVFGKPLSVSKRGPGASATRNYVYDPNERLCKTVEPETGATLLDYDAADNIAWRAPGTALNSLVCDRANVPATAKIRNSYNSRNRLTLTQFGDGAPSIGRSYWPDGKPQTVDSGGANWTMNYNNRRLPTTQVLALDKQTYTLRTEYDANGFVSEQ